ncbi:MAG: hypothetical protein ABI851_04070 [Saprospiraceae bacterium]
MDFFLDFVGSIGPAVVVFITVYYMLNQFFAHERFKTKVLQQQKSNEQILPLKLQAYERLALFLERAKIPNLMLRFPKSDMTESQWISTLMMAVQQEYEHNLVQQVYVSDSLWSIVSLSKDELFHSLNSIANQYENSTHDSATINGDIEHANQTLNKALAAIKQEVKLILT